MNRKREQPKLSEPDAWKRYAPLAVCVFIAVAVVIVFSQTIDHEFVNYDDNVYVGENRNVTQGLTGDGFGWAMTAGYPSNWHPITWLSHMLDCQLFGMNAGGHHATSVLLHATTAVLLFLVLRRMTGDIWPSAFVAVVFAVHPLRVESVAWVAERKDILSGLFFVLTLAAYLGYVRRPFSLARYLIVLAVFALGLMSKPMLVTVPFILLLLDYWPLGRMTSPGSKNLGFSIPSRLLVEKVPLLLLTVVSCIVTSHVQVDAFVKTERLPMPARVGNALVSYVTYLGQSIWPADLAPLYPLPGEGVPDWKVVGSLLVLAGVSAMVFVYRRQIPCLIVGWLWYLGMLVPVIGLVQVGVQAHADRYTYLPQIGLLIALAWGAMRLAAAWPQRRWGFGIASSLIVAVLMGCAWHQTTFWRTSETLWTHTLKYTSDNKVACNNLGVVLIDQNRSSDAMPYLEEALKINPSYLDARLNLGGAFMKMGQVELAATQFEAALETDPDHVKANADYGAAVTRLGRLDLAERHLKKALDIQPFNRDARVNYGIVLAMLGRTDDAMEQYKAAIEIDPNCAEAHHNLAMAWAKTNKLDEAIPEYEATLRIDPDCAEAHANFGVVLQIRGRIAEATTHFRQALALAARQNKQQLAENIKARLRQIAGQEQVPGA
jgi:protein O-mannosyl-transferase